MRLTASWNLVRVDDADPDALSVLRALLTVKDPAAKKSAEYQRGEWDGFHVYALDDRATFPSGLLGLVVDGLKRKRVNYELAYSDRVQADSPWLRGLSLMQVSHDLFRKVTMRDYQVEAVMRVLGGQRGVVQAPPRAGKTLIAFAVAVQVNRRSLYVVNRSKLLEQHVKSAADIGLTLTKMTIPRLLKGQLGQHVIATVQTLYSALKEHPEEARRYLDQVEVLQGDEIHALSDSVMWTSVFTACAAPIRVGYSGTPYQDRTAWDSRDHWLRACCGDLLYQIDPEYLMLTGHLLRPRVFSVKAPGSHSLFKATNWHLLYSRGVVQNAPANALVARIAASAFKGRRRCLVLVSQHEHGHELLRLLFATHGLSCVFSAGGDSMVRATDTQLGYATIRLTDAELLAQFESGGVPVLIGSTVYDQGIDMPFVDTTILAGGWKSPVVVVQRAYRCLTPAQNKRTPVIVDLHHGFSIVLGHHSRARQKEIQARVIPGGEVEQVDPDILCRWLETN